MGKILLSSTLILTSILITGKSALSASFTGNFSVNLKIELDALTFFTLENGANGTADTPIINTSGTGTVSQATSPSSNDWQLDDTFSFLELNYEGGIISGSSGNNGSASATVSGTSKRLVATNNGGGANNLIITGTYSADLNTVSGDTAELSFDFEVLTESGQSLGTVSQMISANDSFTANNQTFSISILSVAVLETIYIQSEISGFAEDIDPEIPEPSTNLGLLTVGIFGFLGTVSKLKRKKNISTSIANELVDEIENNN